MLSNYHTHCYLDDGKGRPEEYIENALTQGFTSLGFSCHAPLSYQNDWALQEKDLPTYLEEIDAVKKQYAGRIEIYRGLEIDYIPGEMGPADPKYVDYDLDYKIGSVHSLKDITTGEDLSVDNTVEEMEALLHNSHGGDIKSLCKEYFTLQIEMLSKPEFNILGHCDLVRKLNKENYFFDPSAKWYLDQAREMLDVAKEVGIIVEVNTGAIARGYTKEFYPSHLLLKEIKIRNIPLMLNADAHVPEKISESFSPSLSIIKEAGFTSLMHMAKGEWNPRPI